MKVIGLAGKAGSGKDTVAEMITMHYKGGKVFKVPFALALKEKATALGWNGEKDTNGRVLLQYIGVREREEDEYYWVDKALNKMESLDGPGVLFVVPDVRFFNEADALQKEKGQVWRIERPGAGLTGAAAQHSSETDLDDYAKFDAVIQNDGSLLVLETKVIAKLLEMG